ncbi:hypothetical protein G4B88_023201 [Cannabis sativa]|uniref:Uncharacterized protein n=1 Tax=Cannabis sativa TaxID=3483 RepID=A0A7J6EH09_CANSA|nr:hypothetical protein G4B88_023201 [Cannabis sativa]
MIRDILLKPKSSALGQSSNLLSLTNDDHDITSHELYSCGKKSNNYSSGLGSHRSTKKYSCPNKYVADDPKATCPDCGSLLNKFLTFVPPPNSTEVGSSSSSSSRANDDVGIVKGVVTYMIMDDLEVKPMSSISSIALLNTFNVKEIGALQEKIVSVGINEGLRLLKASLLTKTLFLSSQTRAAHGSGFWIFGSSGFGSWKCTTELDFRVFGCVGYRVGLFEFGIVGFGSYWAELECVISGLK